MIEGVRHMVPTIQIGDTFVVDDGKQFPGVWRVIKVNPKTVRLENAYGNQLAAEPYFLTPTTEPFEAKVPITLGTVVTVGNGTHHPGKYVVVAVKGETANVAVLGGNNGRYLTAVPFARLTVVEP